jgi:hypothetical protein
VDHLLGSAGGLNGSVHLNPTTVHDDAAVDYLFGGVGTNWYFAPSGSIRDLLASRTQGEKVTWYP